MELHWSLLAETISFVSIGIFGRNWFKLLQPNGIQPLQSLTNFMRNQLFDSVQPIELVLNKACDANRHYGVSSSRPFMTVSLSRFDFKFGIADTNLEGDGNFYFRKCQALQEIALNSAELLLFSVMLLHSSSAKRKPPLRLWRLVPHASCSHWDLAVQTMKMVYTRKSQWWFPYHWNYFTNSIIRKIVSVGYDAISISAIAI